MKLQIVKEKVSNLQESVEEKRFEYIGGSDAGAILGFNDYKSAYTLWAEKTQKVSASFSDNEAMRLGRDLEDYVARRFEEESGKKVHRSNYRYSLKSYPFLVGHVDRIITGENAGLECKTASQLSKTSYENGDIPKSYYAQCQHYMLVTGADHWYIAILVFQKGFYWRRIDRDEDEITALLNAEINFWNLVQNGIPPEIDSSDSTGQTLDSMHQGTDNDIDLGGYQDEIQILLKKQKEIQELQDTVHEIQNTLKAAMANASYGHAVGVKISWKSVESRRLDTKALKQDYPGIYESYQRAVTSQRFQVTEEGNDGIRPSSPELH